MTAKIMPYKLGNSGIWRACYSLKVLGVKRLKNCFWDFHERSGEYQLCNMVEPNRFIFNNPKTDVISVMTYFAK